MNIISEDSYKNLMEKKIEPFLEKIRYDGYFKSFDNNSIHYEEYLNKYAKGSIIVIHGFTESAEKFREMSFYFFNDGYSVFSIDLRGHGKSYKKSKKIETVSEDDFDSYRKDLDIFINSIVVPKSNSNIYIYSHSLGSNVALLYLENKADIVKKAVLSSPMICGNMGMPVAFAGVISKTLCAVGLGEISAPGRCSFKEDMPFNECDATSFERFSYYQNKRIKDIDLKTSGPSFDWVNASLNAKNEILNTNNIQKISADILIFKPGEDKQVLEKYQNEFIYKSNRTNVINIPNSKHEIFFSKNKELEFYLKEILKFFNEL